MNYRSMVCSTSNNITICKDTVTNIAFGQMTLRMKRDESRINRTWEAVRSAGAAATISGYSLSDAKAIVWHLWIIWNAQPLLDGAVLGVILE